jgi:peptide/nickel transport system substrate-binding protein
MEGVRIPSANETMDHSTRRKLLQTGLAAALLAAGGMPVAAGAREGGRLRIGLSGGPGAHRWDPRGGLGVFQTVAGAGLVFETLTEIAPDGLLRGALALSWTPSRMGRVWTLELDPEARFHDATPVTAADVIASLDLHREPGTPGHGIHRLIAGMQALAQRRVAIELHAPNPDFPYLLSDPALIVGPADPARQGFARGLGSGPYRVAAFDGASRLLAERVADPARRHVGCWFETVEILALPRAAARLEALTEGRVDVIDRVPAAELARLARSGEFEVLPLPATDYVRFGCGAACPPDLRAALLAGLRAGIDRHDLGTASVFHPVADIPVRGPVPEIPRHDPVAARATLACFADTGLTLSMDGDLGEAGVRILSAVARQVAALGVRVSLAGPGHPGMIEVSRRTTRPTLEWTLLAGFDNRLSAALGDRLAALSATGGEDAADRASLLSELSGTGPYVIPVLADANLVVSRRIGRPERTGRGWDVAHARLAQRWWRA